MKRNAYLLGFGAVLLVIGLIVLYVFEFRFFDRTLEFNRLFVGSMLLGGVAGFLLGYRFRGAGRELIEKVQLYVFFIVLCALFAPLFGSLSNRLLSWRGTRDVSVEFVNEEPRFASPYGVIIDEPLEANRYYLFFYKDGVLYRIKTDTLHYPDLESGDTIVLPMRRGLWGFDVVGRVK